MRDIPGRAIYFYLRSAVRGVVLIAAVDLNGNIRPIKVARICIRVLGGANMLRI